MQTMTYRHKNISRQHGFTLVELMIVVVIIAILMGIAIPSYQRHVLRANRTAAQAEMMDISNREQQILLSSRAYVDEVGMALTGYAPPAAVAALYTYTIAVGPGPVPSYVITFTPTPGTPQAADPILTLDNAGVKTPADKWEH